MTTNVKNTIAKKSNVVAKLTTGETLKATAKKVAVKKETKVQSTYKADVLKTNAEFKLALRSTGKALKILLSSEVLNSKQIAFIKDLQKNEAKYNKFDATIRRTKSNLITPFFVLQAMYKAMN